VHWLKVNVSLLVINIGAKQYNKLASISEIKLIKR